MFQITLNSKLSGKLFEQILFKDFLFLNYFHCQYKASKYLFHHKNFPEFSLPQLRNDLKILPSDIVTWGWQALRNILIRSIIFEFIFDIKWDGLGKIFSRLCGWGFLQSCYSEINVLKGRLFFVLFMLLFLNGSDLFIDFIGRRIGGWEIFLFHFGGSFNIISVLKVYMFLKVFFRVMALYCCYFMVLKISWVLRGYNYLMDIGIKKPNIIFSNNIGTGNGKLLVAFPAFRAHINIFMHV